MSSNNTLLLCPLPLQSFDVDEGEESIWTTITVFENCVIPCPSIDFNTTEWELTQFLVTFFVCMSAFVSLVVFFAHFGQFQKFYIRIMFIGGFLLNSSIIMIFMLLNRRNSIVCDGPHYIEKSALCIFQAAATIFSFLWTEVWSVILAYDTYLHVFDEMRKWDKAQLRKWYTICAFSISATLTAIPLACGNLGFDPKANIPICLFLVSHNSDFLWSVFVTPFYTLLFISLCLTILCAWRIHQVFISSDHYIASLSNRAALADEPVSPPRDIILFSSSADGSEGRPDMDEGLSYSVRTTESLLAQVAPGNSFDFGFSLDFRLGECDVENGAQGGGDTETGGDHTGTERVADDLERAFCPKDPRGGGSQHHFSAVPLFKPKADSGADAGAGAAAGGRGGGGGCGGGSVRVKAPRGRGGGSARAGFSALAAAARPLAHASQSPHSSSNGSLCSDMGGYNSKIGGYASDSDMRGARAGAARSPDLAGSPLEEPLLLGGPVDHGRAKVKARANGAKGFLYKREQQGRGAAQGCTSCCLCILSTVRGCVRKLTMGEYVEGHDEASSSSSSSLGEGSSDKWGLGGSSSLDPALASSNGSSEASPLKYNVDDRASISTRSSSVRPPGGSSVTNLLAAVWVYNGRSILFVLAFCLTTLSILPVSIKLFGVEFPKYDASAEAFAECLIVASLSCPQQTQQGVNQCGEDMCGSVPAQRPQQYLLLMILLWMAAYGMVPSIIFGCGGQCTRNRLLDPCSVRR